MSFATHDRNNSGSYRIPLAIQFAWSLIICIGMFMLPESPRLYIKKGKNDKAVKSLTFLRRLPADHPAIQQEFEEMRGNFEYEQSLRKPSYIGCFKGNLGKRLMTGIVLQSLQQLVSPGCRSYCFGRITPLTNKLRSVSTSSFTTAHHTSPPESTQRSPMPSSSPSLPT